MFHVWNSFSSNAHCTSRKSKSINECRGPVKHKKSVKVRLCSYQSVLTFVLGIQKNRLIEMVLLSTTTYVLVEKQEK